MTIPEINLTHIANWDLMGVTLMIKRAPEGDYCAFSNCDSFSGVVTASSLDKLYHEVVDAINLFNGVVL